MVGLCTEDARCTYSKEIIETKQLALRSTSRLLGDPFFLIPSFVIKTYIANVRQTSSEMSILFAYL